MRRKTCSVTIAGMSAMQRSKQLLRYEVLVGMADTKAVFQALRWSVKFMRQAVLWGSINGQSLPCCMVCSCIRGMLMRLTKSVTLKKTIRRSAVLLYKSDMYDQYTKIKLSALNEEKCRSVHQSDRKRYQTNQNCTGCRRS